MGKIVNQAFFDGTTDSVQPQRKEKIEKKGVQEVINKPEPRNNIEIRTSLLDLVSNTINTLNEVGMPTLSRRVQNVFNQIKRETAFPGSIILRREPNGPRSGLFCRLC